MEFLTSYNIIIEASLIIILSFVFGEVARKTNIPSVLMLIALGIGLKFVLDTITDQEINFDDILEVLGIVGLIMIVLEAALELKLERDKLIPILKALGIALVGLLLSTWIAAMILQYFIDGMSTQTAWIYATPLSILSSAIIIPSVVGLRQDKKEFHVYESTFSDILGIMLFYFLTGQIAEDAAEHSSNGVVGFFINVVLTIVLSLVASYIIILIFQNIRSHTKLFLLIAVLLLLYAVGKLAHLSSLIIILVFGLIIANMKLFFSGRLAKWLHIEKAKHIYEGLHVVTMETAFVVRTFFFVIFGLTISLESLASWNVVAISALIILSIYVIRYALLRTSVGRDSFPQTFIAPRGLITILLFDNIPDEVLVPGFEDGILLFIIIATSLIMTIAMVRDKQRTTEAVRKATGSPVVFEKWRAPKL